MTGPAGEVVRPAYTDELDYEGELAVVIGRRGRDVPPRPTPWRTSFGYAVMNDVSARDRQREEPQWIRARAATRSRPSGPG